MDPTIQNVNNFLSILVISLVGVLIFIMKRKNLWNKYALDSMELLIIMIMPCAAVIPLLSKPIWYLWFFSLIYFGTILVWYYIGLKIANDAEEKEDDNKKKSKEVFWFNSKMWVVLIIIGIVMQIMLVYLVPLPVLTPSPINATK
jgi:Na+/H+ antiporter NhaC